jgi:hypothetical protein
MSRRWQGERYSSFPYLSPFRLSFYPELDFRDIYGWGNLIRFW